MCTWRAHIVTGKWQVVWEFVRFVDVAESARRRLEAKTVTMVRGPCTTRQYAPRNVTRVIIISSPCPDDNDWEDRSRGNARVSAVERVRTVSPVAISGTIKSKIKKLESSATYEVTWPDRPRAEENVYYVYFAVSTTVNSHPVRTGLYKCNTVIVTHVLRVGSAVAQLWTACEIRG